VKVPGESIAAIKRQIRDYILDPAKGGGEEAEVKVTTARELSEKDWAAIIGKISKRLGHEVFAERTVDKSIIGGIIVQVGDNVYDGSVARRFKQYNSMMSTIDVKKIGVTGEV
jgi:ATP synthase F1 delta subunit